MSALLIVAVIALVLLGLMRFAGLRGPLLTIAAAALAFGAAGYMLQGRPGLSGVSRSASGPSVPLALGAARAELMDQFGPGMHWLVMADSLEGRGQTADAVNLLSTQIRRTPRNYALWIGLGNSLADHSRGMTPAADFAFRRAAELAPGHPAPGYFRGLALVRSQQVEEGRAEWLKLLAAAPPTAKWRPYVELSIRLFAGGEPDQSEEPVQMGS